MPAHSEQGVNVAMAAMTMAAMKWILTGAQLSLAPLRSFFIEVAFLRWGGVFEVGWGFLD